MKISVILICYCEEIVVFIFKGFFIFKLWLIGWSLIKKTLFILKYPELTRKLCFLSLKPIVIYFLSDYGLKRQNNKIVEYIFMYVKIFWFNNIIYNIITPRKNLKIVYINFPKVATNKISREIWNSLWYI